MYNKLITTALVTAMSAFLLAGCNSNKIFKTDQKKPTKLTQLSESITVLQPVFSTKIEQGAKLKRDAVKKKDAIDLQVAFNTYGLVTANRSGTVKAFADSSAIWSTNIADAITSGVAASDQIVMVGTRSAKIIALDAKDGNKLWETSLPSVSLTPALIVGRYAVVSANNGATYGLDARTGTIIWQYTTQNSALSIRGAAKPTLLNASTVLIGSADGRVHVLNISTGTPILVERVGVASGSGDISRLRDVDGEPLVSSDGYLYAGSYSGQLLGYNTNGQNVGFTELLPTSQALAIYKNQLIGSSIYGEIVSFDRITGEKIWQNDDLKYRGLTNPVIIGQYIAVGDAQGFIHVLDFTGKIISRVDSKTPLTSLQVHNNRLYAQGGDVLNVWQF